MGAARSPAPPPCPRPSSFKLCPGGKWLQYGFCPCPGHPTQVWWAGPWVWTAPAARAGRRTCLISRGSPAVTLGQVSGIRGALVCAPGPLQWVLCRKRLEFCVWRVRGRKNKPTEGGCCGPGGVEGATKALRLGGEGRGGVGRGGAGLGLRTCLSPSSSSSNRENSGWTSGRTEQGSPTAAAARSLYTFSWKYGRWQGADGPGPLQKTAGLGDLECLGGRAV